MSSHGAYSSGQPPTDSKTRRDSPMAEPKANGEKAPYADSGTSWASRIHAGFRASTSRGDATKSCSARVANIDARNPGETSSSASTKTSFSAYASFAPTFRA